MISGDQHCCLGHRASCFVKSRVSCSARAVLGLLAFLWPFALWYTVMIFITAYFVLLATAGTLLMKNALIAYLLEARKEGTLLEDEGRKKETTEEA